MQFQIARVHYQRYSTLFGDTRCDFDATGAERDGCRYRSSSSSSGGGGGGGRSSSSSKLLYLHDRKILQYCKSIFILINNKTRLIVL